MNQPYDTNYEKRNAISYPIQALCRAGKRQRIPPLMAQQAGCAGAFLPY